MRIADPHAARRESTKETTIFAVSQRQGSRPHQEDHWAHFGDECFALADGVGGMPHGAVAARLAADTAIWAYQHVRQRRFYWQDKKLLLARIFRTANICIWQKRRETGFEQGLATTLLVCITGTRTFWAGGVGDSCIYLWREGIFAKLIDEDIDEYGYLTKALGITRYGLAPNYYSDRFIANDVIVMVSDGVSNYLSEDKIKTMIEASGNTLEEVSTTAQKLLEAAAAMGSRDNMTAGVIKRVATPLAALSQIEA